MDISELNGRCHRAVFLQSYREKSVFLPFPPSRAAWIPELVASIFRGSNGQLIFLMMGHSDTTSPLSLIWTHDYIGSARIIHDTVSWLANLIPAATLILLCHDNTFKILRIRMRTFWEESALPTTDSIFWGKYATFYVSIKR